MKLTEDLINKLLDTKNELQFADIIFSNKINIEEWQSNEAVFRHQQKLRREIDKTASRMSDNIVTEIWKHDKNSENHH